MKKLVALLFVSAAVLVSGVGGAGAKGPGPDALYVGPAEGSLPSSGLRGFDDEAGAEVLGVELSRGDAGASARPAEGALPSSGLRGYGG